MYSQEKGFYVAHCEAGDLSIVGKMVNRHGLIAGATGTGKTVSLQVLAESFSAAGIPCFMADMKGDLSGISKAGVMTDYIQKHCGEFGIDSPQFAGCPTVFYDVFGEEGHPMRSTISNMGPQLLSRIMNLNDTQSGIMDIVFRVADEKGLLLIDLKDLRAMLNYVAQNAKQISAEYGQVSSTSVNTIQRALLSLENQGADKFFGEPSFDINDLMRVQNGRGVMSVLAADKLMQNPKLYSTFLLWLLSDIYTTLPEVGDLDMPKLVFFFDEAHTLFEDTSSALVSKIEQVVRLIRSKGVGVFFVTQNPTDIPDTVLGQLGNRVQHALRAFTPKDQKAVKSAAETFRANPKFDTAEVISQLGVGEALVSFLDEKGTPNVVERAKILFPLSQIGAITPQERQQVMQGSAVAGKYDTMIDRESAFEDLMKQSEAAQAQSTDGGDGEEKKPAEKKEKESGGKKKSIWGGLLGSVLTTVTRSVGSSVASSIFGKRAKNMGTSVAKQATSSAVRSITRGILGNLIK